MKPAARQKRYQRSVLAVAAVALIAAIGLASCMGDDVPEIPANVAGLSALARN